MFVYSIIIAILIGATPASSFAASVEIILDASGSMASRLPDGIPKIDAAKTAILSLLDTLEPDLHVAFRAYGHQSAREMKDCKDTQLLVPFQRANEAKQHIASVLSDVRPRGYTPITWVLEQAANDFNPVSTGQNATGNAIILVSDGKETCDGDPCATALALAKMGIRPIIHVIGFDVDTAATLQLSCVARAGGGRYVSVGDAKGLADALKVASQSSETVSSTRVLMLPDARPGVIAVDGADLTGHTVTEAESGKEVAKLSHVKGSAELPPGIYNVSVGQVLVKSVEIRPGETTTIRPGRIEVKGAVIAGHAILDPETGEKVGSVSSSQPSTAVMAGRYELTFGSVRWPFEIREGQRLLISPGIVTASGLDIRGLNIFTASGEKAGNISASASSLPLPPGQYLIEKNGQRYPFSLKEGERLQVQ